MLNSETLSEALSMVKIQTGSQQLTLTLSNAVIVNPALVKIRLTSEATSAVKETFALTTPVWDGRSLQFGLSVNVPPYTSPGKVELTSPDYPDGFYLLEVLEGATIRGAAYCLLERTASDPGYRTFTPYNDTRQYQTYEG